MNVLMRLTLAMVVVLACRTAVAQPSQNPARSIEVRTASIFASRDIELGAPEAGIITEMNVVEGASVREGQEIAKIDDREAQMQKQVAEYALNAARQRAEDEIEITYARAAQKVAQADHERMLKANEARRGTFPEVDVERARLDSVRSGLAVEKAEIDKKLAGYDADVSQAELEAANKAIERRTVRAPFDGEVVELITHQGEWAHPGDPIVNLAKLDTLHVYGKLDFAGIAPHLVRGCRVTVSADVGNGQTYKTEGRIILVGSEVHGYDPSTFNFDVRAEIANVRHNESWLILPGAQATMTIHLGTQQPELGSTP